MRPSVQSSMQFPSWRSTQLLFLCLLMSGLCLGCKKVTSTPLNPLPAPVALPSGLRYQVLATGNGDEAHAGDRIEVHYTGLLEDGTRFDSSRDRGEPFPFRLGAGQVIKGWDEGLEGMREGEQRRLTLPPGLGYGSDGSGRIPPNATLTFEVELVKVY